MRIPVRAAIALAVLMARPKALREHLAEPRSEGRCGLGPAHAC